MQKRLISILALVGILVCLFVGCGEKSMLTDAQAQQAAFEAVGLAGAGIADAHTHFNVVDGVPQFEVHFSHNGQDYTVVIHGQTGEILSQGK